MNKLELDETNCIKPGMDLLVTNWIGLSGTAKIAGEKEAQLGSRLPLHLIETAKGFSKYYDTGRERQIAGEHGTKAVFALGRGGILSLLWQAADASKTGLDIDLREIPIRQETVEICEFYRLNPYFLESEGALLIADFQGHALVKTFEREGIPARIIGCANDSNDRVLWKEEERSFLNRPQEDELEKIAGTDYKYKKE